MVSKFFSSFARIFGIIRCNFLIGNMHIRKVSNTILAKYIRELNLITLGECDISKSLDALEETEPQGVVAYQDGEMIGWGAYLPHNKQCHIIVRPEYRRMGVGKKLVNRLTKDFPDGRFCPWDNKSENFYKYTKSDIHPDYT